MASNKFSSLEKVQFIAKEFLPKIQIIQVDFSDPIPDQEIPSDISAAYYLIHSMSSSTKFDELEERCAANFKQALEQTQAEQVIYLSGISNDKNL